MKGCFKPHVFLVLAIFTGIQVFLVFYVFNHLRISVTPSDGYRIFWVKNRCEYRRGEYVEFPPKPGDRFAPPGSLLLKRITCLYPDRIELRGRTFYCNGKPVARALERSWDGRKLPLFRPGVKVIPRGFYFVTGSHPRAYDSRYFGLVSKEEIRHCLKPLI